MKRSQTSGHESQVTNNQLPEQAAKVRPELPHPFLVEFAVHLYYDKGNTTFQREEQLPFVPFVGLDVLDDALGEFHLEHVAWYSKTSAFYCQSRVDRTYMNIRSAVRLMSRAGWIEQKELREKGHDGLCPETADCKTSQVRTLPQSAVSQPSANFLSSGEHGSLTGEMT